MASAQRFKVFIGDNEAVWASVAGDGLYRIDNIPISADFNYGDVVLLSEVGNRMRCRQLVKRDWTFKSCLVTDWHATATLQRIVVALKDKGLPFENVVPGFMVVAHKEQNDVEDLLTELKIVQTKTTLLI